MIRADILLVILAMGAVTYLPRALPLLVLSGRDLPRWMVEWLQVMPAAILSALLAPELLAAGDPRHIDLLRPEFFAALPTFVCALFTRSLAGTVVCGMLCYWLIGRLLG